MTKKKSLEEILEPYLPECVFCPEQDDQCPECLGTGKDKSPVNDLSFLLSVLDEKEITWSLISVKQFQVFDTNKNKYALNASGKTVWGKTPLEAVKKAILEVDNEREG